MRAVTIKEAKAKLNELIEAATNGEDVVILRGSEHVAAIIPITEADLELSPRVTDEQVKRLTSYVASERAAGRTVQFDTPEELVAYLKALPQEAAGAREGRAPKPVPAKPARTPQAGGKANPRRRANRVR